MEMEMVVVVVVVCMEDCRLLLSGFFRQAYLLLVIRESLVRLVRSLRGMKAPELALVAILILEFFFN